MKKSIIFGVLAMFAVGAMSIQSAEAQNPVKKNKENTEAVTKQPEKVNSDCCNGQKTACKKHKESKDANCCVEPKSIKEVRRVAPKPEVKTEETKKASPAKKEE